MSAEHQPLGDIWSELSLMPRAVVSYYAHIYGHDALHVLEWIVDHVVAQSVARRDQATLDIPDWLQEFAQTPEWNLVRYTASRVGLGSGLAAIEIVETFADKDPSFDHEAFALFEVGKEQLPRARRLVQFYADRAGHGETRALRFLVGLFTRHDADFVQADYQAFCEDNVEERVGSVSVISQLEEWSRDSGESLGLVVERCVSRFAEEDKAFRRIQFRRWLEDSYLTGLPGPVDSALVCEQMRRWLGFHREGRIAAEKGGCPFADVVSNPVRDFHDLKTIHDMYDAAEETSEDESSDDKHVALVRAVFRATWPRSESFEDYIPQEGIFAEDGVEYPAWLRFSVRFGAGALGVKVHDHQSTLHDFLFLTTTTIMNDPIKLIGAAGGNQDLADPELVFQPYFSISPFSWGKHQAVKFRVQPRADCKPESL
ncbi:MAG: hypothetical protein VX834_09300, partial [Myxococcota bacterium]|nr:hypothetical protein [Myxococcota bacterium]